MSKIKLLIIFSLIASFCGFKFILSVFNKPEHNLNQITSQVMAHPMSDIIKRCQKDFGYSDQDMIILEKELKRFLILAAIEDGSLGMYSKHVDNLWHTFILFTKEYAQFCNKFAGKFIHHAPTIDQEKTPLYKIELQNDFEFFIKKYESSFNEKVHDIWFLDACKNK